jgi:hypothetical protein
MRRINRLALLCASVLVLLSFPVTAWADPGEDHGHDDIPVPVPSLPKVGPGIVNMELLDVSDKDGTTNSDIAFYGNLAFVGNYDGFRVINVRRPGQLRLLSDTKCRANQGDLSVP